MQAFEFYLPQKVLEFASKDPGKCQKVGVGNSFLAEKGLLIK